MHFNKDTKNLFPRYCNNYPENKFVYFPDDKVPNGLECMHYDKPSDGAMKLLKIRMEKLLKGDFNNNYKYFLNNDFSGDSCGSSCGFLVTANKIISENNEIKYKITKNVIFGSGKNMEASIFIDDPSLFEVLYHFIDTETFYSIVECYGDSEQSAECAKVYNIIKNLRKIIKLT
jgi:hypothetical protein